MDELFDWQHITSPLEEEEVDVSLMSVLLGIDWLVCIRINIRTYICTCVLVFCAFIITRSYFGIKHNDTVCVHNIHVLHTYA